VIRTSPRLPFASRLLEIHDGLCEVIGKHQPDRAAIEEVFMARNPMSALKLGHARGVLMLAASKHGLAIHEYSAKKIKLAVSGHGGAEKSQVQHMVRIILKLATSPSQDAADALAVALCHANLYHHPSKIVGITPATAAPFYD
jgi:crossover junction endodeoxyribonuclease RuvC